ncbi:MAG: SdrD B-like domain-containing protein, partial [Bacteroidia bacterium]
NYKINLLDENGKIIQTKKSDKSGQFTFENIPSDKNYAVSIDENDPALKKNDKLHLLNSKDQLIKMVAKIGDYFVFQNLSADLNKMSVISATDTTKLIVMKGKILSGTNTSSDGIKDIEVELSDKKGKVVQKTRTDKYGLFRFENLSPDENYSIKLNENDPALSSLKKIFLANDADKIVKEIDIKKKNNSFKNLPADLMQLTELKESYMTSAADSVATIIHKNVMYPGDEKYDFVIYFPYNKKEIDISVGSFLLLMEKVAKKINEKGSATIIVAASSSTVPTKSFTGNEELAKVRADEIKDKVHASMSLKNIDPGKISYEVSAKVLGPDYKNDAMQNRKEYEKWQFVKVIVK